MKLIHCSDIHLDASMGSYLSPEKAEERRNELLITFVRMVRYAAKSQVEGILIAGDLFDGDQISPATLEIVEQCISGNPNILFFYTSAYGLQDPLLRAFKNKPDNLIFFIEQSSYRMGDNVVISAPRSPEELTLDPSDLNIVLFHGIIQPAQWRGRNIDYLALGYAHDLEEGSLGIRGKYCYSGSLEGRDFEATGEKGFVRLDINNGIIDPVFVRAAARSFFVFPVDITGMNHAGELDQKITQALNENAVTAEDFVEIRLIGQTASGTDLQIPYLIQHYSGLFYYFSIIDEAEAIEIQSSIASYNISLRGEFIRVVSELTMSENEKAKILRTGINALEGRPLNEGIS